VNYRRAGERLAAAHIRGIARSVLRTPTSEQFFQVHGALPLLYLVRNVLIVFRQIFVEEWFAGAARDNS